MFFSLLRHQPVLVVVMGFLSAGMLGALLWSVAAVTVSSSAANEAEAERPEMAVQAEEHHGGSEVVGAAGQRAAALSPAFTREVLHWEPHILGWAAEYGLNPNLVATLIQIESCGNAQAMSAAGARGLFQVMPFHFEPGEDMLDPEVNARRGLSYFAKALVLTEGHVGLAFVGYNGGHGATQGSWESWPAETRRYYRWGSGIFNDVSTGLVDSPTLHDWLAAGGASLCRQAAAQLGLR